jgi:catechol 2,3-dioxygenase-like lactoylglutathione lyase family enzyme
MTRIDAIMPLFIVSNLRESIDFYCDVLGFELRTSLPETDPFFAIVARDGVGILLKHISADVPPQPNRQQHEWAQWDAFVSTLDPDSLAAECQRHGTVVGFDVQDTDDGLRGFEVVEPDAYVLFFGRPVGE